MSRCSGVMFGEGLLENSTLYIIAVTKIIITVRGEHVATSVTSLA